MTDEYESPLSRSLRESIALACRLMIEHDLKPSHVSVRLPGSECILIRARGGGTTFADTALVALGDGALRAGKEPPIELPLHLEIYRRRADVQAALHTHQPHAVRLGDRSADDPQNTRPIYPSSDQITTFERGRDVATLLGSGSTVFLRRHGMAFAGESIEHVVDLALRLEEQARDSVGLGNDARDSQAHR